ncbi:MBL fold metallo-hydrolase [Rhodohalobacter sp. 8-1]|uniref:MBL fold metallo-hydrolase n=1 Tax=Rhodohalobacter sp. 8-1 TaxID=3131972 RepID=UPI0030ED38AD
MVKVIPLYEGTFSVAIDKIFRRIDKSDPPHKNALKLSINPFLIQDDNQNILFDAGLGDLLGQDTSIDMILGNLEEQGVLDFEVTDVFLSHLHFDHMGGLAHQKNGYWELTFSEADIWVSEAGWKKLSESIDSQDERKRDFFHFLDSHANLQMLTGNSSNPISNIRVETIGGHTEHHQALYYENVDHKYVMAGDVIGTRSAINRSYAAKYDFDPKQSMKVRKEIQELSYSEGHVIMAYHETDNPMFRLTGYDDNKGYKIENISA